MFVLLLQKEKSGGTVPAGELCSPVGEVLPEQQDNE